MNKGISGLLLAVFALGFLLPAAHAADDGYEPGTTQASVDAGLALGGDKLATVTFTNGDTKTLHAGDGLFASMGAQHNFADTDWAFRGTLGFKYNAISASNGTISFTRYPLDLLAIYSHERHHIGFGLAYDMSGRLDMDGFGPNADFKNAAGLVLQYQYWMFGVRYTSIKYKVSNCSGTCNSIDGSSLAFLFNYQF